MTLAYLSLGAGVQSSALLVLANRGELDPAPAFAVFADTHGEPAAVYRHLAALEAWSTVPVVRVSAGSLTAQLVGSGGRMPIPAYVQADDGRFAPSRRACTRDFKVDPIERHVRAYLAERGLEKRALCYLGISVEEAQRMRASRTWWSENRYPLVDRGLTRSACFALVVAAGLPEQPKSACVYCPYRNDHAWARMKAEAPADFAEACRVDAAIRLRPDAGLERPAFVHRSGVPLAEAVLPRPDQGRLDFGGCEEGHCGV